MQTISVEPIKNKKEMMAFIRMPWMIYKQNNFWVPPLISSEKSNFDLNNHPFWKENPHQFWLAYRGKKIVGRIACFINLSHNQSFKEKTGFWGYLEAIDDQEVFSALLQKVEEWLIKMNCNNAMGPVFPSLHYEMGTLIENFHSSPYLMLPYNLPYYPTRIEKEGYKKEKDFYSYLISKENLIGQHKLLRVINALKKRYKVKLRSIDIKQFDSEIKKLRTLYNAIFFNHWGMTTISEEEFNYLAKDMKLILDPDLLLIAEIDGEQIGFIMAFPNYNEVFKKIKNGKLYPFGFLKILFGKRKIKTARAYTLGLVEKYQKSGIGSILYSELANRLTSKGYSEAEMSWILEDNFLMNKSAEMLGGKLNKKYRLYRKQFSI